jgi:hypothetical protein
VTRILMCLVGATMSLSVVAPRAQAAREWPTYSIKAAPTALRPSIQYGDLVILSIQNAVLSELSRALAEGGPATAVRVCHMSALTVAYWAGSEEGVAGGRTSARLRSPANAPPPWAAPVVARLADRRTSGVDGFAVDLGARVGVMRPVAHRAVCAPCHGRDEQLSPRVRAELNELFPHDRATGFREGDLRGWLWVEVPKK